MEGIIEILEGDAERTIAALRGMSDVELLATRSLVDQALEVIEGWEGAVLVEGKVPRKATALANAHSNAMRSLTKSLEDGRIGLDAYNREAQASITQVFTDAYATGKGVKPVDLTAGDKEWIRRAAEYETKFARKFGKDIDGDALRMPREQRADMYGFTVEGVAWHGNVEAQGNSVRIHWKLGFAEHCIDCLLLACFTSPRVPTLVADLENGGAPHEAALGNVMPGQYVRSHRGEWRKVTARRTSHAHAAREFGVIRTMAGLFGITLDHGLWTSRGWLPASKVGPDSDIACKTGIVGFDASAHEPALLTSLIGRSPLAVNDPVVQVLKRRLQEHDAEDVYLRLGQVVPVGTVDADIELHDLSVEWDMSFTAGGLLVHNSNSPYTKESLPTTPRSGDTKCLSRCRCRLDYAYGRLSAAEREDTAEYTKRRDATLGELMDPEPPPGTRRPNDDERRYIDGLRNKVNYYRRAISTGTMDKRHAIAMRKAFNAELDEFVSAQGIFEVPVYSVDDVIDGRHLGRRAKRDIFNRGLDGESADAAAASLRSAVDWYEAQVGEKFSDKELADLVSEAKGPMQGRPVATPYLAQREKGADAIVTWNVIGETLLDTVRLLGKALLASVWTSVHIAPFDDEMLARVGLWVEGDPGECEVVLRAIGVEMPEKQSEE